MLLGIDWAINMNEVINLKKWTMSFERKSPHVVVPLDLVEGPCDTEPVREHEECDDDLDQIYKITVQDQDWVNPTVEKWIAWDCKRSCTSNSYE